MAISMTWPQYLRKECSIGEFTIRLSPTEAEILLLLMLRYPGLVTMQEIIDWAYKDDPDGGPLTAQNTIEVITGRLRAKVGEYHIHSRKGFGWRLVQKPEKRYREVDLKKVGSATHRKNTKGKPRRYE